MVRTGAFAYLEYGYETTYGTIASTINKVFGLEQKITSHTYTNNKIVLSEFNQVTPKTFAFGTARGTIGLDFVLSNPWWLNSIFDNVVNGGAAPFTHTYSISSKLITPITVKTGVDVTTDVLRACRGAIVNSVDIRTSIGELARCSADIQYGIESTFTPINATPATDDIAFPYTFAHGSLEFPNGTVIAELQSIDLRLNQNADLLYSHGNNQPVGAYRKLFEITGNFSASMVDYAQLNRLYGQIGINSQTQATENPATLKLKFTNGLAGSNERTIQFDGTGVVIDEHSVSVEPNEPIFENIPFQVRTMTAVANNNTSSPP